MSTSYINILHPTSYRSSEANYNRKAKKSNQRKEKKSKQSSNEDNKSITSMSITFQKRIMLKLGSIMLLQTLLLVIVVISVVILMIQMHVLDNYDSSLSSSSSSSSSSLLSSLQLSSLSIIGEKSSLEEYQRRQQQDSKANNQEDEEEDEEEEEDDDIDDDLKPILKILRQGGYDVSKKNKLIDRSLLPKWSEILKAYGPPKIIGLESSCQAYQDKVESKQRNIAPVGIFNTGTNLLTHLLRDNCDWSNSGRRHSFFEATQWQVPWGKHIPAASRTNHTHNKKHPPYHTTLPVVAIRDPYTWMQSMCRQNYAAQFEHSKSECPNIIPYPADKEAHPRFKKMKYVPVNVKYSTDYRVHYDSLAHLWNDWYENYIEFNEHEHEHEHEHEYDKHATMKEPSFPFLIVRMEDLVFHAQTVVPQLCECAGAEFKGAGGKNGKGEGEIKHYARVANDNSGIDVSKGHDTGLLRSIIKYGNFTNRRKGYPKFQLEAAKEILDSRLMNLLAYPYEEP